MFPETTLRRLDESSNDVEVQSEDRITENALDKSVVAELSESAIDNMTCDELVRVIRAAALTYALHSNFDHRLPYYDRATLRRMAYLARRCCRNQGF